MPGSEIRVGKVMAMDHERDERPLAASAGRARNPSWLALLLGLIPYVAMCFTVGLWDHIYPVVAGLPFNIFWLILWTLLTPLCMWGAYRCEQRNSAEEPWARRRDQQ
jgi:hypothetical protein